MTELVVHIGYYKTGTTYLQNVVFPALDVVYHDIDTSTKVLQSLVFTDDIDYNPTDVENHLRSVVIEGKTNLFSFESLVGPMFMYAGINRSLIAERLKMLGFSKIIITIRSQEKIIESYYRQYINVGGVLRFNRFLDSDFFNPGFFQYDKLIHRYDELFGTENLHIALQESLIQKKEDEIDRLCSFMSCKYNTEREPKGFANISLSNLSLHILRFFNHFTANYFRPSNLICSRFTTWKVRYVLQRILDPLFLKYISSGKSFTKENSKVKKIVQNYIKGNSVINKRYNLSMEDFNYPLDK